MPAGKRSLGKPVTGRAVPGSGNFASDDINRARCPIHSPHELPTSRVISPRHIPQPYVPENDGLVFEIYMFVFTFTASFLQFLNLYRSVWWLPHSYTRYSMNFYLIDPYLVGFIIIILGRRLLFTVLLHFLSKYAPPSLWPMFKKFLTLLLLITVLTSLVYCAYHIMKNHPIVNLFYLCYPISVYFILFGLSVLPFFDVSSFPCSSKDTKKKSFLEQPIHSCSTSPQFIRKEVESFKTDFNSRMKQLLFSSVLNAYYSGFVPCCFAQASLYYDTYWTTQHLALVWLGCFTLQSTYCYPFSYCDTLHRAALHLGRWIKVQGRGQHIPTHVWDESVLWGQGALVRHSKDLYKAEGVTTAAEPGNSMHWRFYALFKDPSLFFMLQLCLQISLVVFHLAALASAWEWYQILSVGLLLFLNYIILFGHARNYLVSFRVYDVEYMIQQKLSG